MYLWQTCLIFDNKYLYVASSDISLSLLTVLMHIILKLKHSSINASRKTKTKLIPDEPLQLQLAVRFNISWHLKTYFSKLCCSLWCCNNFCIWFVDGETNVSWKPVYTLQKAPLRHSFNLNDKTQLNHWSDTN